MGADLTQSHAPETQATLQELRESPQHEFTQRTTPYMVVFSIWVAMFAWLANFDAAFGGIVLIMDPYIKAFGTCESTMAADGSVTETCSISSLKKSLIQLTVLFMSLGGALSAVIGDYLGRRGTLQLACLLVAVGAGGMMGSEGSFTNYMVCKCIGGVGIGLIYSAAPTWGTESVSPKHRGILMSLYNFGLGSGNVVAAAICVGSSKFTNNWSWRTPICCQIPVAGILAFFSLFFHESPRWLLTKGKEEKARRSFARFNKCQPHDAEVDWLVNEVNGHILFEREMASTVSWRDIFSGIDLKRTHIAVLVLLGNALTGIQFIIPYTAMFLAQLGLNNPYALNVAISACILGGAVPGPLVCEYIGRRTSLIGGYILMASCMIIFAGVASGLGEETNTAKNVLIAFLCIWAFVFGCTSGPIVWVSSAEMHAQRLRTIGQSYAVAIYEIFSFGSAFWTPYMLDAGYGDMGTNVGYFYFGITIVIIVLTWIFVPETGRLSLEEIDEYFNSGKPAWRTSLRINKKVAEGNNLFITAEKEGQAQHVEAA